MFYVFCWCLKSISTQRCEPQLMQLLEEWSLPSPSMNPLQSAPSETVKQLRFFLFGKRTQEVARNPTIPSWKLYFLWIVDVVMEKNPLVMMLMVVWKSSNKEQCDVFFGERCFDVHFPLYMIMQMLVIVAQEMIPIHYIVSRCKPNNLSIRFNQICIYICIYIYLHYMYGMYIYIYVQTTMDLIPFASLLLFNVKDAQHLRGVSHGSIRGPSWQCHW